MGLVRTTLTLTNPKRPELDPVEVNALVDSGALHLCVPEHVALQLQLDEHDKREVALADGSKRLISYQGPLAVAVGKRDVLRAPWSLAPRCFLAPSPWRTWT